MKNLRIITAILFFILLFVSTSFTESPDKRKEILLYGLESEIIDLIQDLKNAKDYSFNEPIKILFESTKSVGVRETILTFFAEQENPEFKNYCLEVIDNPYDYRNSTVLAAFSYIEKNRITEAAPKIRTILDNETTDFRDSAIRTLGKIGGDEDAAYLFDYFKNDIVGDEKQRLVIRQNIMKSLGELKTEAVLEDFIQITEDEDENVMIRATAVRALGSIGKVESIPLFARLFEEDDPILRAAVISALSGYSEQDAVDIVLEGLKDTHYRVRLEALATVQEQCDVKAAPYVRYRATNDPVEAVKMKSFEVLAVLGEVESIQWMKEGVREEKTPDKTRMRIMSVLMEHNPDTIIEDVIAVAYASLKDDKKTWIRYELGKLFAKIKDSRLSDVAEAYIIHSDTVTKSLGIEIYNRNRYANLKSHVETIAENDKMGGLQSHAKRALAAE
ncbi:MAG TPA: HEAT repeat domain-containing protein [Treponema sp.]|nr:HEAT repeat domain-containing protein [Treponema sp.]